MAQRCLYGVDKNPMAVDLAKLSLWLATLAKDHPFTFLDHALQCGDSLVGLTKAQIVGFHWKPEKQRDFARAAIEGQLSRALDQRRQIREAPDGTSEALLRERLTAADGFLDPGRRYGDLVVAAFFAADNDRKRKERLESLSDDLAAQRSQFDVARHQRLEAAVGGLRGGPHPVVPFHWEIEFPEVFDRENPGFDAFVGNPPFAGKNTIAAGHAAGYPDWLKTIHEESHGNADLVAHFFRRAFDLLRRGRRVRPDRHEHDRPGRHAQRPACAGSASTAARSTRRPDARSGRGRRPWSSAWSMSHKGSAARTVPTRRTHRCRSSPPISSTPAATTTRRKLQANAGKSFVREVSSSAWASRSTTPTRRASHRRSPRCSD